ncbi:hypothetical protein KKD03_03325 [Patescibacteria group bacterium]|nr:hypothetical protein [Patescibacteria group bacterium]
MPRKILLWIFVGLLSLGQFQRIELGGNFGGINIYFHDIFIFLWLINFAFIKKINLIHSKNFLQKTIKKYKIEAIFTGIAIMGITLNVLLNKDVISLLYTLRLISYILFSLTLKYLVSNKLLDKSELRFKFFGTGLIILLIGFLQLATIKDTRFLAVLGWDDHLNRLISTIFDPGFTGIILVISLLYFYSLKTIGKNFKILGNNIVSILITLSFFLGIALTFSRATYLALVVALLTLGIIKKKTFTTSFLKIIIFIAIVFLIPKPGGEGVDLARTSTITARTSVLQYEISIIAPKTLFIGNGLFSEQNSLEKNKFIPSHSRMPDNFLINLLLSTGLTGTGIAIYILIKWVVKISKLDPELSVAILATLIHAQFNNSAFQPFVLLMVLGGITSIKTKNLKLKVKN